ncbi:hypothetical protein E2C01_071853 [Portunus trituberculatus]|uniref:Uncharacterized protein n=1 Tax=Portunus trituberculatus TaxID=210409 RepID=A0A5B7HY41_PORTR|nr:hypothetical protein [Portunus trituberculatus]
METSLDTSTAGMRGAGHLFTPPPPRKTPAASGYFCRRGRTSTSPPDHVLRAG